jgi:hypothetical protein
MKRFALLLLLVCFPSLASAQDTPRLISPGQVEIEALRGLDSVTVEVKSTVPGLDSEAVADAVERRLKLERVPVVSSSRPHAGRILVTLSGSGDVVLIRLKLSKLATTDCESGMFFTVMWEREQFSSVKAGHVAFDVSYVVDLFGSDYNSINRR